jgi:hypothetical protein
MIENHQLDNSSRNELREADSRRAGCSPCSGVNPPPPPFIPRANPLLIISQAVAIARLAQKRGCPVKDLLPQLSNGLLVVHKLQQWQDHLRQARTSLCGECFSA